MTIPATRVPGFCACCSSKKK
ncbi:MULTISPECIES: hypothetical protein [unclassified Nostoc]|nr:MULTISPECIES: hypothetical protein [unclassified Nostoc]